MIFFCFSSKDRHIIVESIFFHITNYAIPVWYDRHKMLLGDERDYKNFVEGVNQNKYAVIILSRNTIESVCAREEIDLIYERYVQGQMQVFPIFYNIRAADLPDEFTWMTKLVYKELNQDTDSLSTCNHIICKVLFDEISKYKIKSINSFLHQYGENPNYHYLTHLIKSYCSISDDNHDAQIALLYSACIYIINFNNLQNTPKFYYEGVERLFSETRLHLPIDLRETLILERLCLLLINSSIFGYLI
ncbi:MAG: hypothetical protein K0S61_2634 [Anaerocolumna sp.]|jgi:hypothetical protein|nr:hypothetical protein [Anaerocolumna sp.]